MGATCTVQTYRNSCKFFSKSNKKIGDGHLKNSSEGSRVILALLLKVFFPIEIKIFDCVERINSFPNSKILHWSKLKVFADDNSYVA